MPNTRYLRVRNFEKFQNFNFKNLKNDPKPAWIKLWGSLLDDEAFFELPDACKFHVVGMFLVAAQNNNLFKANVRWLEKQIGANVPIDLDRLLESRFIEEVDVPEHTHTQNLGQILEKAKSEVESALNPLEDRESILDPDRESILDPEKEALRVREEEEKKRKEERRIKQVALSRLLSDGFERLWQRYPVKDGRKEAERHFSASVKTEQDLTDIDVALTNYLRHISLNDWKRPKNGKTWFNNWRDFVNWQESTVAPEDPVSPEEIRKILGKKHDE